MNLKKGRKHWIAVMAFAMMISVDGCYYDKGELLNTGPTTPTDCATSRASFKSDVLPLVTSQCAVSGCHDASASGGFIFQNYNQISAARQSIQTEAIILKVMPPSGPLLPAEINTLKCWIDGGAPDN